MDRISLSFPIDGFHKAPSAWVTMTDFLPGGAEEKRKRNYGGSVEVEGVKVFVGVSEIGATRRAFGKIEFNPSRIIDPDGYGVVSVEDAQEAVSAAWEASFSLLSPSVYGEDAKVKRLDVTRDFSGVESPGNLIRALSPINRPWARRNLVHADPQRHGAQTLMVGTGAGVVRLYDKEAETQGKAPPGSVRWEAEARAGWLDRYGGIGHWKDVTTETVGLLALDRWEWSAMGVEVSGMNRVIDKVSQSGLSDREQCMFLGWLVRQAGGDGWTPASKTTAAKWRRLQRDLGIAIGDLADDGAGFVSRLDFETGREVLRVA